MCAQRRRGKNKGDVISKLEPSYGSCISGEVPRWDYVGGSWKSNWFGSKRPVEFKAEKMTSGVPNLRRKARLRLDACRHALRVPFEVFNEALPCRCYVDNTTSGKPVLRHNSKHSSATSCSSVYECISGSEDQSTTATAVIKKPQYAGEKGVGTTIFERESLHYLLKGSKKYRAEDQKKRRSNCRVVSKLNDNLTIGKISRILIYFKVK